MGFHGIFVSSVTKFWIKKMRCFGLFRAKRSEIGIQNPKLIVTYDYQQFLVHFDWFLSLKFQIKKTCIVTSQAKSKKNGIFCAKNLFQKFFSKLFLSPNQSYVKKNQVKGFKKGFL